MSAVAVPFERVPTSAEAARLFEEHYDELLGYCLRQLGSRAEAEDAVQTTFLYALRALRRGVVPESEAAWLTAIAKNVCRSTWRTQSRRREVGDDVDVDTIALAQPDPDDEELLMGLREALATLPDTQRRALVMREWHGVSQGEIAATLGLSAGATNALLTRARRSLAHALTLPRRTAFGLLGLVVELRSWVKPLLAGTSTKAAVAVVVVTGAGVGVTGSIEARAPRVAPPASPPVVAERPAARPAPPASRAVGSQETSARAEREQRPAETVVRPPARSGPSTIAPTAPERPQATAPSTTPTFAPPRQAPPADPAKPQPVPKLPLEPPALPLPDLPLDELLPPVEVPPELPPPDLLPPVQTGDLPGADDVLPPGSTPPLSALPLP